MVKYICPKCEKDFDQKQKFERHLVRIRPCTSKPRNEIITPSSLKPLIGLKFIDLFCGIGGFHIALSNLGAECVLACDIDAKCREIYKDNFGLEPKPDVTKLETKDIPPFDILCGGFPCQAFSHAGKQGGFEDTRGTLFRDICRILRDCQPKYFILENVKNLKGHDSGKTIKVIYKTLQETGYTTHNNPILLSPHHIGVPQHRERVFILGIRNDIVGQNKIKDFPPISPTKTDISTILEDKKYPELELKKNDIAILDMWEEFVQYFKSQNIKLPTFPIWSEDWESTYEIKDLPGWKQNFITQNREFYTTHKNFLSKWLESAQKNSQFNGARSKFEWQCGGFKPDDSIWNQLFTFRPSGIRVKRGNYSGALVAMAQIVHVGSKRRKLSPREVARLQSFPDTFKIAESKSVAYKQFGNSVNVAVITHMAKFLIESML